MASSINAYPITIQSGSFQEGCKFQGVDVDVYLETTGFQRQHYSFGSADTWTFTCVEDADAVAWVDSVAYKLNSVITQGTQVVLVADYGTAHSLPPGQLVYVLSVRVWYSEAMKAR